MNNTREERRRQKYREIISAIQEPAHIQKALAQLVLDTNRLFGDKCKLSPAMAEATKGLKALNNWRLKAIEKLFAGPLRALHPKTFKEDDGVYNFGKVYGMSGDIAAMAAGLENEPKLLDLFDKGILPLFVRNEDDFQAIEKSSELIQKAVDSVADSKPSERKRFKAGETAGTAELVTDDGGPAHSHNSTEICKQLLMLGDYIDCLHTRKELHEFLIELSGEKVAGKFSTFNKLCQDIGLLSPSYVRRNKKLEGSKKKRPL